MKISKNAYFLMAVLGGASWGTHGTFASLLGQYGVSDTTVSMLCPLFYASFFLILVWKDDIKKLRLSKKYIPIMLFYGLEVAVYNFVIIKAYWLIPVGIVHTIVFCNLFLLMIFSRILFKTPLSWQKGVAALVAVAGVAMLLNVFDAEVTWSTFGLICALLSMAAWAGIVITEKYLLVKDLDGNVLMVYSGYIAMFLLLFTADPVVAVKEICSSVAVSGGMSLLPLGGYALITSVGSYFFYLLAIRHLEPAVCQLGYVADPLVATILGVLVFGQVLLPVQWVGLVVILCVVAAVQIGEVRQEKSVA